MNGTKEKYADRIAKLLRKAESTTPEEAEALVAKAQALMTQYAIDEQMIARAQGRKLHDEITEDSLRYTGIFQASLLDLGFSVASVNNCRSFFSKHTYTKPTSHVLHVVGFKSDIEAVRLLATSLEVQLVTAMKAWERGAGVDAMMDMSKMDKFKTRREFIIGFTRAVSSRLIQAKKDGERAAAQAEAERSSTTTTEAASSVALVLRDKESQVRDWFDDRYARGLRKVRRNYAAGAQSGRDAGVAAGHNANIGGTGVAGPRGALR